MKGVYAGVCHDVYSAHQGVEHDNMNVICFGSRVIGTALAILLFVIAGNPASGGPFARELLPGLWALIGGLLPPGAGTDAVRNIVYFDGNATLGPILVLAAWAALSAVVLVAAGPGRGSGTSDEELLGAAAAAA
mgnify:CR=1 FL=1